MINAQQSIGTCHEALQTNPLVREYAIVFAYSIKPFIQIFQLVWIFIPMMYGAYAAVTKYKNHLIKTIPVKL